MRARGHEGTSALGVARHGVVLSWGNFSHYTEVLFRSHFLLLLIKIFHGRRRWAEVQIPCRYKAQKSAPGRRHGGLAVRRQGELSSSHASASASASGSRWASPRGAADN